MDLLIQAVAAVFCRLAPMTLVAPLAFFTYIPLLVRTLFTLSFSIVIVLALGSDVILPDGFQWSFLASEFFLGIVLSLGFHAANAALHMASQLIDVQMGLAAGATFDPVNYQTTSPTGTLFSLLMVASFFGTNLHYEFLYFFGELFRFAPVGGIYFPNEGFMSAISKIFVLGFMVASPVILILFLIDVVLALMSRSMPQAQIYFVALPLKILVGFVALALVIKLAGDSLHLLLAESLSTWEHLRK